MTSDPDKLKGAWTGSAKSTHDFADNDVGEDIDPAMDDYIAEEWEAELGDVDIGPPVTPPPPPERLSGHKKTKPRTLLKLMAVMLLLLAATALAFVKIPGIAKSKLESKLHAAGFPLAQVGSIDLGPSSLSAQSIKLDQYGFDEVKTLQADVNWINFMTSGDLNSLSLSGVKLGRDASTIGPDVRQMIGNLLLLPGYRVSVNDATIDITTDFGEIRVTMEGTVQPDPETSQHIINARVQSSQFQLGFDSTWKGTLSAETGLDLSAEIVDGRLNIGPLRVSRYNGWAGIAMKDAGYTLESQMDAGSATFMDVPLQNLSLVTSYGAGMTNIIFRSGISGMPDVLFTADLLRNDTGPVFTAALSGQNLGMFLDYIEEATGRPKEIRPELVDFASFRFKMDFESDKRFVGGPLPFFIGLASNDQSVMQGNILVYPDTLEVRGSLETSDELALAFQDYFKISSENMRQNYIRLDGDLRRFFAFGDPAETTTLPAVQ